MNAEQLVLEVVDIIQEPSYSTDDVLLLLNQAQINIANKIRLPDLSNGFNQVSTVLDTNRTPLPDDFCRGLYMAQVDGEHVNISHELGTFALVTEKVSLEVGDITDITTLSTELIYQKVPLTITTIDLWYYRNPVPMQESTLSFPDGIKNNDDYDWALIHSACNRVFDRIEDESEGPKKNTLSHKSDYGERLNAVDVFATQKGKIYPMRPSILTPWPGVS